MAVFGRGSSPRAVVRRGAAAHAAPGPVEVSQGEASDDTPLPAGFALVFYATGFLGMSSFTAVLPTIEPYAASLGAGPWFAGLLTAAPLMPSIALTILAPRTVKTSYMTLVRLDTLCCMAGSVMYGLGQLAKSYWLILFGQLVRGILAAPMVYAFQNALNLCAGKKTRTAAMSRNINCSFLGMGLGPVCAAGLMNIEFSLGALRVDRFTNPGWVFACIWLAVHLLTYLVPEPKRHFSEEVSEDLGGSDEERSLPPEVRLARRSAFLASVWCLAAILTASAIIATWETSSVAILRNFFGWSDQSAAVFLGVVFCSTTLGGRLAKVLLGRGFGEGRLMVAGWAAVFAGNLLCFWYLPDPGSLAPAVRAAGEVPYAVGSALLLNAVNVTRTFAITIANRAAAEGGGRRLQDRVGVAFTILLYLGRSSGALLGMGLSSRPGGINLAAGAIAALIAATLGGLCVPSLRRRVLTL